MKLKYVAEYMGTSQQVFVKRLLRVRQWAEHWKCKDELDTARVRLACWRENGKSHLDKTVHQGTQVQPDFRGSSQEEMPSSQSGILIIIWFFFIVCFLAAPYPTAWSRKWPPTPVFLPGKSH